MREWRRDLESPGRIAGLITKVQLCLFGCLTKERCIATYLFARWVCDTKRKMGWLGTALYIKSCGVALQRYYGNSEKTIHLPLPFPVSLNRSGIPRCIPSFHRKMISRRDETADQLVRFYLSMFSLSKLILVRKKGRFGYDSIVKRPSTYSIGP